MASGDTLPGADKLEPLGFLSIDNNKTVQDDERDPLPLSLYSTHPIQVE